MCAKGKVGRGGGKKRKKKKKIKKENKIKIKEKKEGRDETAWREHEDKESWKEIRWVPRFESNIKVDSNIKFAGKGPKWNLPTL